MLNFMSLSYQAYAYDDAGAFYRDEVIQVDPGQSCGSLCLSSPNYFEGYLFQQERNARIFSPELARKKNNKQQKKLNALNYKEVGNRDYIRGIGWGPTTDVSRFFVRRSVRWSRVARDVGFQVEERGKSLHSAMWREIRKPILYTVRDRIRAPYRSKRLHLSEKVKVWFLEQAVDTGASTLNLDGYGGARSGSINTDFNITNTIVRFNPRLDPYKGRYGVRFKARRYVRKSRPVLLALTANYCNSTAGFGDRLCAYEYEFSTSFSFVNPTRKWSSSAYVSYQTESLDLDVYIVDGQMYDHKPWLAGVTLTYSFY